MLSEKSSHGAVTIFANPITCACTLVNYYTKFPVCSQHCVSSNVSSHSFFLMRYSIATGCTTANKKIILPSLPCSKENPGDEVVVNEIEGGNTMLHVKEIVLCERRHASLAL